MDEKRRKPIGGFVFVPAMHLIEAWWAYKRRSIRFIDLRVWFACHALVATRCCLEEGRPARFRMEELHHFVGGVGGAHIRNAVRRLEKAGLLTWSESSPSVHAPGTGANLDDVLELVKNQRRKVPVPRKVLRLLAASGRPVLMATVLGHLVRCMYYRDHQCSPNGLCKASWIASVFGVDIRNVKAARLELETPRDDEPGLLIRGHAPWWVVNKEGVPMRFNLAWSGDCSHRKSPPRPELSTTDSSPPIRTGNSSFGRSENQKPASRRPIGACKQAGRGRRPSIRHVVPDDLRDANRLLTLYGQAKRLGLANGTAMGRLQFFAAAEHAKMVGKRNPCGLFAAIIRRGLHRFITQGEEDAASRKLKRLVADDLKSESRQVRRLPTIAVPRESPAHIRHLVEESLGLTLERGRRVVTDSHDFAISAVERVRHRTSRPDDESPGPELRREQGEWP